jgi:serine/threonine protein kinase
VWQMLDSSVDRTTNSTYLVMELACGGDLQNKLFAVGHLSEQTAKYFFIQMVSAIKYCHDRSPQIAHRDLSPANMLLTDDSDFAGVKVSGPHVLQNVFFFLIFFFFFFFFFFGYFLFCLFYFCNVLAV